MNGHDEKILDSYRSLLLLSEIAKEEDISQRELAKRLGIALGLVNSYIKNLVAKGYVRVKNFPKNRYAYLLTPQGVSEKSRLAYQHFSYFTSLYTVARQDYVKLFQEMEKAGVGRVVFCGIDEVAEIAYLALKGTSIELAGAMDDEKNGERFFELAVLSIAIGLLRGNHRIVISSLKRRDALRERLVSMGVPVENIYEPGKKVRK